MKSKSPKQQLSVIPNPQNASKQKFVRQKQLKKQKIQEKSQEKVQSSSFSSPNKRDELKKVQNDIQLMKNKIQLLKQQLQKEQQTIKINKNKTQEVIKKKINVSKIQKYKEKDLSLDSERAQKLRVRNASLRQSHQNEMQNILKAIYLVKLDDARQIKSLSKNYKRQIQQMNDSIWNQQLQRKKKVAEESQKAKMKYEKYWKEKLASIFQNQSKNKAQIEKVMFDKKDQLKQLRQLQLKLLEDMNKVQVKQIQAKKEYFAALSLPAKDVAAALNRSSSSLQATNGRYENEQKLNRMNSQMVKLKKSQKMSLNFSGISVLNDSIFKSSQEDRISKPLKLPNSKVNKDKLSVILKQLKRLQKKQKQQKFQKQL